MASGTSSSFWARQIGLLQLKSTLCHAVFSAHRKVNKAKSLGLHLVAIEDDLMDGEREGTCVPPAATAGGRRVSSHLRASDVEALALEQVSQLQLGEIKWEAADIDVH